MKKTTFHSQKFSKRLVRYSALSVAIVGVLDVSGQIMYTDVDPDVGGVQLLDLDTDTNIDFVLLQDSFGMPPNPAVRMFPVQSVYGPGNAVLASAAYVTSMFSFVYPYAMNFNDPISSNPAWNSNYQYMDLQYGNCYTNSNWCNGVGVANDKYIGLRFFIGANTHYGWARLSVTDASNWLLKDYAYEQTPGMGIAAGDTGVLGLEDNTLNNVKIVALNKSIGLYNLTGNTNYNLFSISGQSVLKGSIDNDTYVIEANTVATGVYIIELVDKETSAVIRKKIVL